MFLLQLKPHGHPYIRKTVINQVLIKVTALDACKSN
jgi:hypothetical protein